MEATKPISMRDTARELIIDYIASAKLAPGDKLPSEAEMQEQFAVSRASLREALRMLEGAGIVYAKQGGGVYLSEYDPSMLLDRLQYITFCKQDVSDLFEVRRCVELWLIRQVAVSIDEVQLTKLDDIMKKMTSSTSARESHKIDSEFHIALYESIPNRLVQRLVALYWDMMLNYYLPRGIDSLPAMNVTIHRRLLAALHQHNAELAYACMLLHLDDILALPAIDHAADPTEISDPLGKKEI